MFALRDETSRINPTTPLPKCSGVLEDDDANPNALADAKRRWMNRTAAEILAARERIFELTPEPRPLPLGKTLNDVIEGTWPGDETDEEIFEFLERLS